jgi:dienelactone hydrolase
MGSTTVEELAARQAPYTSGCFEHPTEIGMISRRVLRRERAGSAVILIHEAPGFSRSTFDLAQVLFDRGFTVVLPELLDIPPKGGLKTVVRLCIARELGALSHGTTSPIADWLRHLADREYEASGQRPVGVIGMCFSGGFALATVLNEHVGAAVMSQPGLPFLWPRDPGVDPDELARIKDRVDGGACLRALRYRSDIRSPAARIRQLRRDFPKMEHVQIPSWNPLRHSVLANAVGPSARRELVAALNGTIDFLVRNLQPDPAATPPSG